MKLLSKIAFCLILATQMSIAKETKYNKLFMQYGSAYQIPAELLWGIAKQESNFNPKAVNYNSNGTIDIGLMQINSVHEKMIKELKFTMEDLYKPEVSIYLASKILAKCFKKYGFTYYGLNCYNGRVSDNSYHKKVLEHITERRERLNKYLDSRIIK